MIGRRLARSLDPAADASARHRRRAGRSPADAALALTMRGPGGTYTCAHAAPICETRVVSARGQAQRETAHTLRRSLCHAHQRHNRTPRGRTRRQGLGRHSHPTRRPARPGQSKRRGVSRPVRPRRRYGRRYRPAHRRGNRSRPRRSRRRHRRRLHHRRPHRCSSKRPRLRLQLAPVRWLRRSAARHRRQRQRPACRHPNSRRSGRTYNRVPCRTRRSCKGHRPCMLRKSHNLRRRFHCTCQRGMASTKRLGCRSMFRLGRWHNWPSPAKTLRNPPRRTCKAWPQRGSTSPTSIQRTR